MGFPIPPLEVGKQFGYLTVLEDTGKRTKGKQRIVKCKCDCPREKCKGETEVIMLNLRNGHTKSCGVGRMPLPQGEAAFNALYNHKKYDAKRRGHKWNLTKAQFKQLTQEDCFYCGAAPSQQKTGDTNGQYVYQGIDRMYRLSDYDYNHCVPCCKYCNSKKRTKDWDEYMDQLESEV